MDLRNFFKPIGKSASSTSSESVSKKSSESDEKVHVVHKSLSNNSKDVAAKTTKKRVTKSDPIKKTIITDISDDDEVLTVLKKSSVSKLLEKQITKQNVSVKSIDTRVPMTINDRVKQNSSSKRVLSSTSPSKNKRRYINDSDSEDDYIPQLEKEDEKEYNAIVDDEALSSDDDVILDNEIDEDNDDIKVTKKKQTKSPRKTQKKSKKDDSIDIDIDIDTKSPKKTRKPRKTSKDKEEGDTNDAPVIKVAVTNGARFPWMGPSKPPPHKGSKAIPVGEEGCLEGLAFVLTGVNDSLEREEMKELIEKYGGVVRTAVSGKTNYLVAGIELEDGRSIEEGSKYKNAIAKKVSIIDEDKLLDMIRCTCEQPTIQDNHGNNQVKNEEIAPSLAIKEEEVKMENNTIPSPPMNRRGIVYEEFEEEQPQALKIKPISSVDESLFTSKYAPHTLEDLVGNRNSILALRDWLNRWNNVHILKTVKVQYNKQNPGAKAVLISGPPGIGKTTCVSVLARLNGYELTELNASDKRNQGTIREELNNIISNNTLNNLSSFSNHKLIVMDEVDGMSSGDRGGIAELIRIIKTTTSPIICICNDRDNAKIRSLVNSCFDLPFIKPTPLEVHNRIDYIVKREQLHISSEDIKRLITSTDGDMRQILNQLQMIQTLQGDIASVSIKDTLYSHQKDVILGNTGFDAVKILFQGNKIPFSRRYDAFFLDYELTPLIIQQNYIDSFKSTHSSNSTSLESIQQLSDAAESLSDMDCVTNSLKSNSDYSLLPVLASMAVRTGSLAEGRVWPRFPFILGKLSSMNKNKRLIAELTMHASPIIHTNNKSIRLDYFTSLRNHLLDPILNNNNVDECIQIIDEYELTKEDFIDTLNGIYLPGTLKIFEKVPAKQKGAFTRKYNSSNHIHSNIFEDDNNLFTRVNRTKGKKGGKAKEKETKSKSQKTQVNEDSDDSFIDNNEEEDYYTYE
ncbi:hypothetical protein WA158_000138 [Blastocystis sp. Blastoise]